MPAIHVNIASGGPLLVAHINVSLPRMQALNLAGATSSKVNERMSAICEQIKSDKVQGLLIAGLLIAGLIALGIVVLLFALGFKRGIMDFAEQLLQTIKKKEDKQ